MKKAPSTLAAMMILAVFLCLGISDLIAGNCSFCLCASDATCSNSDDCVSTTGCQSKTFNVPCSGEYQFGAKVICENGADACEDCHACVNIYKITGEFVANQHNDNCDTGECYNVFTVNLVANQRYVLYACLQTCTATDDCTVCGQSCTAYGCIWKNIVYPCIPL